MLRRGDTEEDFDETQALRWGCRSGTKVWSWKKKPCFRGAECDTCPVSFHGCRCGNDETVSATAVYFIIKDYLQPTACWSSLVQAVRKKALQNIPVSHFIRICLLTPGRQLMSFNSPLLHFSLFLQCLFSSQGDFSYSRKKYYQPFAQTVANLTWMMDGLPQDFFSD